MYIPIPLLIAIIFGLIAIIAAICWLAHWLELLCNQHLSDEPIFKPKWSGAERRREARRKRKETLL